MHYTAAQSMNKSINFTWYKGVKQFVLIYLSWTFGNHALKTFHPSNLRQGMGWINSILFYSMRGYCSSNKKDLAKGKDCRDWNPLIAFGWCRQDLKDFNKLCQALRAKSTFNEVEASKFISTFKHWYGFSIHFELVCNWFKIVRCCERQGTLRLWPFDVWSAWLLISI